jgi:hypothetical protein
MKKKIRKSEQLPKYGTVLRSRLVESVQTLPGYQEGIQKGFPLFTKNELDEIKERYKKDKLTWEEIDKILSRKGIFLKKATFRKYIQDGNISEAIGYKNIKNSRVAIFPADTIAHINFIQFFYKVLEKKDADQILEIVQDWKVTYSDAIEHLLDENIFKSIIDYIVYRNEETIDSIEEALEQRPADRDNILKTLEDICNEYLKTLEPKISKLVDLLEEKTMNFSETMKEGKESMWKRKRLEFERSVDEGMPAMKKAVLESERSSDKGISVPVTMNDEEETKNE